MDMACKYFKVLSHFFNIDISNNNRHKQYGRWKAESQKGSDFL